METIIKELYLAFVKEDTLQNSERYKRIMCEYKQLEDILQNTLAPQQRRDLALFCEQTAHS